MRVLIVIRINIDTTTNNTHATRNDDNDDDDDDDDTFEMALLSAPASWALGTGEYSCSGSSSPVSRIKTIMLKQQTHETYKQLLIKHHKHVRQFRGCRAARGAARRDDQRSRMHRQVCVCVCIYIYIYIHKSYIHMYTYMYREREIHTHTVYIYSVIYDYYVCFSLSLYTSLSLSLSIIYNTIYVYTHNRQA